MMRMCFMAGNPQFRGTHPGLEIRRSPSDHKAGTAAVQNGLSRYGNGPTYTGERRGRSPGHAPHHRVTIDAAVFERRADVTRHQ
jgi:hypothetical protein